MSYSEYALKHKPVFMKTQCVLCYNEAQTELDKLCTVVRSPLRTYS